MLVLAVTLALALVVLALAMEVVVVLVVVMVLLPVLLLLLLVGLVRKAIKVEGRNEGVLNWGCGVIHQKRRILIPTWYTQSVYIIRI